MTKRRPCTALLPSRGGAVQVCPTEARASVGHAGGPCVALLLEYDALPELGHACGHNLIASAGLGAALAVRSAPGEVDGTLLAVGTPAEEGGGGKVTEVDAGVFDGVDAALMFHPGVHSRSWAPLTAQVQVRVGLHGRAAHPTGNPTEGIDALAALLQLFHTLAVLGGRLPSGSHVQGAAAAASTSGRRAMLASAEALACTAADVGARPRVSFSPPVSPPGRRERSSPRCRPHRARPSRRRLRCADSARPPR